MNKIWSSLDGAIILQWSHSHSGKVHILHQPETIIKDSIVKGSAIMNYLWYKGRLTKIQFFYANVGYKTAISEYSDVFLAQ